MSSDPICKYDFSYSNIFVMIGRMLIIVGIVLSILLFDRGNILSPRALLLSSPTGLTVPTVPIVPKSS
jgi:hypothetical protein